MTQAWLTVVGLALDLVGFLILLYEWWLAVFAERRQRELEAERERAAELSRLMLQAASNPHMQRHLETANRLQQSAATSRARGEHNQATGRRKLAFIAATVLILTGGILQLIGAIPGCCSMLGVFPSGS